MSALQSGDPAKLGYTPPGFDTREEDVAKLNRFVSSLPAPRESPREHHTVHDVSEGESVFNSIGCADCHVPDVKPVLNLFSDLSLHDMAAELQAASPAPPGSAQLAAVSTLRTYPIRGPFSGAAPVYYSGSASQIIPIPEPMADPEIPQFPRPETQAIHRWQILRCTSLHSG